MSNDKATPRPWIARLKHWWAAATACEHRWVLPFRDVEGDRGRGAIVFVCTTCREVVR